MLKDHLLEMYNFNCWGRDLMLDMAEALTPEQFDQETRFPIHTVKETLVHTLSAEYAYRMRCQGQTYTGLEKVHVPGFEIDPRSLEWGRARDAPLSDGLRSGRHR